jgi:tetratricopeptide (TPR) repeat protein
VIKSKIAQQIAAHLETGARLGQCGQFEEAISQFHLAAALQSDRADCYFNLGVAYRRLGQLADALAAFEKAVDLNAGWPEAQFNLGNSYRDAGRHDLAVKCFEIAIQQRPAYLKALNNLANVLLKQGQLSRAAQLLRRAIEFKPGYAEGHFNLARVYRKQRRFHDALIHTEKAVQLQPQSPLYQVKLAELQNLTGQSQAAQSTLERVLASQPNDANATLQLAILLRDQGKQTDAVEMLDRAIENGTATLDLLWQRADLLRLQRRYDEALADLQRALEIDANSAIVHNLRGVILLGQGDAEGAIGSYERALEDRPQMAEVHNNLGAALQTMRRYGESRRALDTAVRLKPDFVSARLNRALSTLREGNFIDGWREFEWRLLSPDYRISPLNRPIWAGEPLDGKTILLRCEQGLGDTFQFIRYASSIKDLGARVIVECQEAACELVSRAPGVDEVRKRGAALPQVDVQIPLMSLPAVLATTLDTIPSSVPYLSADAERVAEWKEKLARLGAFVVGIAWQGNRNYQGDHLRSVPLHFFRALAEIPDVTLVSLQKHAGTEQLNDKREFQVHRFADEIDASGPFQDTAAIITACDLVITSDTAIAHLAGALASPVWVALSYSADWRWLIEGDKCPWYPTMRLFRQPEFKDWANVFQAISDELRLVQQGRRDRLLPQSCPGPTSEFQIATSAGELIDKVTILEIKERNLKDAVKLSNVRRELESLRQALGAYAPSPTPSLVELTNKLREINQALWRIEDEIRSCERIQDFGPKFVELARSVYLTNDQRAAVKRQINAILGSALQEEKSYV